MESKETLRLNELNNSIKNCKKCKLYQNRKNAVTGYGNIKAKIMFIGEAPGRNEDIQGKPFVGSAGKLLDYLLNKIGLKRDEVYITNVVKCRPPNNRTPLKEEIEACIPYLKEEIDIIKPEIIVALGRTSGEALSLISNQKWEGIEKERGIMKEIEYNNMKIKIMSTYHPAAALYRPEIKNKLEQDFEKINNISKERKGKNLLDFI
ncbi:MAG: uracil-DNA glycosylase [Caldisphaera sp.]|jgi:DNA polymerase|uniref:type-4 uracil-DNA glycosylase n=1 Tax=Caldisphaera sp. TaxID=2060322 RepID=UPI000CA7F1A0|nr:type-4 uracil-DNA glycosylase [Caldisphaera sp.]PMP90316.1 MAG: uracil-DNA glycosylase [Caldisphaera sp.]